MESSSADTGNRTPKKAKKLDSPNFEIDLKSGVDSVNDGCEMDQEYFEESPLEGDTRIVAYSKLVSYENSTSNEGKTENVLNDKAKPIKPIMVKDITDITDFTTKLEKACDPSFLVEFAGK